MKLPILLLRGDDALDVELQWPTGKDDEPLGRYVVRGPSRILKALEQVTVENLEDGEQQASATMTISGKITTPASMGTTITESMRHCGGMPLNATKQAFVYPAEGLESALEAMNLTDEPWGASTRARFSSGAESQRLAAPCFLPLPPATRHPGLSFAHSYTFAQATSSSSAALRSSTTATRSSASTRSPSSQPNIISTFRSSTAL